MRAKGNISIKKKRKKKENFFIWISLLCGNTYQNPKMKLLLKVQMSIAIQTNRPMELKQYLLCYNSEFQIKTNRNAVITPFGPISMHIDRK